MKKCLTVIMIVALIAVGFLAAKVIDKDDTPKVEVSAVSIAEQLSNLEYAKGDAEAKIDQTELLNEASLNRLNY